MRDTMITTDKYFSGIRHSDNREFHGSIEKVGETERGVFVVLSNMSHDPEDYGRKHKTVYVNECHVWDLFPTREALDLHLEAVTA